MRTVAVVAVLFVSLAFAGCFSSSNFSSSRGGGGTGQEQVVPIVVLSALIQPGRCFDGAQAFGDICHVLEVQVDNSGYKNSRDVNSLTWAAEDDGGAVHDFPQTSIDAVAGGAVVKMKVSFTLPDGPAKLVNVEYRMFQAHGEGPVPAY